MPYENRTYRYAVGDQVMYQETGDPTPRLVTVVEILPHSAIPYDVYPGTRCEYRREQRAEEYSDRAEAAYENELSPVVPGVLGFPTREE